MTEQLQKHIHQLLDLKHEFIKAACKKRHTPRDELIADDLTNAAMIGQAIDYISHDRFADAIEVLKEVQEEYSTLAWVERVESTGRLLPVSCDER